MLVDKGTRIFEVLLKVVVDHLVAEVQLGVERLVYNVEPVGFSHQRAVAFDACVHRIFEGIRKGRVELLVNMLWQVNADVAPWLRGEVGVAACGKREEKYEKQVFQLDKMVRW